MSLGKELYVAKSAALKAARAIMRIADESYKTPQQADRSILTAADLEADRILKEILLGEFASYGWLSEETVDDARRFGCQRVWIVDPMDGTREFVMKNPEFVVSVGLVEDGIPILGVICNPSTGDVYEAAVGCGMKLNDEPVTCDHKLENKPKVEVSRSDIEKGRFSAFEQLVELRPCGSIAYKMARLAAGKADSTLSITPKNEWDIAAGVMLIIAAGGKVTDLSGKPHLFNQPDTLVNGVIAATSDSYSTIKEMVDSVNSNK